VRPETRYVTCAYCRAPLVVVRTTSSVFTDLAARQKELERIDREWEQEKQREHMWTNKSGAQRPLDELLEANIALNVLFGLVLFAALLFAIAHREILFFLVILGPCLPIAGLLAHTIGRVRRYRRAEGAYRARRAAAEQQQWDDSLA
jgi:hypothetical protein